MDLPKKTFAPSDIDWSGSERLGDGSNIDADVFRATIPSFSDKDIVLKVFRPYTPNQHTPRSLISRRQYTPFDREYEAYSVIQNDEEAKSDPPVAKALFWFEFPAGSQLGEHMHLDESAKVIVKEFIRENSAGFDFNCLQKMMKHRQILNRLQIYVTDTHLANYVNGILVDLSAAWVLPQVDGLRGHNIEDQLYYLQRSVLQHHNKLELGPPPQARLVKKKWDQLMEEQKEMVKL